MLQKGDFTKQRIVEKAMHLFAAQGYAQTSIDDIAKATKLTKGGVYGHFSSKKEIWVAAHKECSRVWKRIVLDGAAGTTDPLERIVRVVENSMTRYIGGDVFEGGCLLFGSLVEHAGTSSELCDISLNGFTAFAKLLHSWLEEAAQKDMLKDNVDCQAVATFIVVALSGAGPLYTASRNPEVWQRTLEQLVRYIEHIRKPG